MSMSSILTVWNPAGPALASLVALGATTIALGTDFTWDGGAGDDDELWSTDDNWAGDASPPLDLESCLLIFGATGTDQSPDAGNANYVAIGGLLFTGAGGDDELWETADNWDPNGAPGLDLESCLLIFGPTGADQSPDAGSDDYFNIGGLRFTGADSNLTLIGTGSLSFDDSLAIIRNDSAFAQTINIDLVGNGTFLVIDASTGEMTFGGQIDLSGDSGEDMVTLRMLGASDLTFDGRIRGDGGLLITSSGIVTLNGNNTFSGGTRLSSAAGVTLVLGNNGALGSGELTVVLDNAIQSDNDNRRISNDVVINAMRTLTFSGGNDLQLTGEISGDGDLEINTNGDSQRLTLSGENTLVGNTIITQGTLVIGNDGALGQGSLILQGDGTLRSDKNSRTISNDVYVDVNRLTFLGADNLELAGEIHDTGGAGEIVKGGSGSTLIISADSSTTYTGLLQINAGEVFLSGALGGEIVVRDTGTLSGGGSTGGNLTNEDGGTVRVGDGIGTFTVGGDYTQETGSTLAVELSAEDLTNDLLAVSGDAVLEADSTISASVVGTGYIPNGTEFTILTANSITDNGVEVVVESATVTVSLMGDMDGDPSFSLELLRATDAYRAAADGSANKAIGRSLDSLQSIADDDPTGDAGGLLALLDGFNTDDYNEAVSELSPEPYNAITSTVVDAARSFTSQQATYLAGRRFGLVAMTQALHAVGPAPGSLAMAGDDPSVLPAAFAQAEAAQAVAEEGLWSNYVRFQAVFSDQDSGPNRTGYTASLIGGQVGVDYAFSPELIGGLALGYTSTSADLDGGAGDLGDENLRGGPYMSWTKGNLFVDGSLTFGYHFYDGQRNIPSLDLVANSDFDGFDVTTYLGTGYHYEVARGIFLTPTWSLQHTYFSFNSYSESGAAGANLTVADRQANSLRSRLGGNVAFKIDWGVELVPYAFLGWEHEFFEDEDIEAAFSVGGSPFTIDTGAGSANSVFIGGGVNALLKHNVSAFIRYEASIASDSEVSGFAAGVSIAF